MKTRQEIETTMQAIVNNYGPLPGERQYGMQTITNSLLLDIRDLLMKQSKTLDNIVCEHDYEEVNMACPDKYQNCFEHKRNICKKCSKVISN